MEEISRGITEAKSRREQDRKATMQSDAPVRGEESPVGRHGRQAGPSLAHGMELFPIGT